MILAGTEIERRVKSGEIEITPYNPAHLGPNSYNLTLADELQIYRMSGGYLDAAKENVTDTVSIPESGLVIYPGHLYLARTVEHTYTPTLVPMLIGRSSVGRLGMFVHVTAGFGDIGFKGYWTLELSVIHPLRIYPGMKICQIYYHTVEGVLKQYEGKYAGNSGIQASQLYKEFSGQNGTYIMLKSSTHVCEKQNNADQEDGQVNK